jgi:glycosyltransferase involved in cell wall biosynthesis
LHFASEWALALFGGRIVAVSDGEFAAIKFMLCQKSLIYNGVDVDAIRALAVSAAVTPKKHFRVVVSGRIETPKNPFLVARMASQSPENWEWIWIGDGSLRKPLEDSGRFVVTGWVDRPIALALVKSADAYIQASLWEGMSFALLEAMALGRTCIVSNVVGNRDLIKNGVSGYSCDNDEVRFLRILNHVSANPNDAERLGNRALDSVRQRFSLETMVGNWNNLYAKMIVRRHRAAGISG